MYKVLVLIETSLHLNTSIHLVVASKPEMTCEIVALKVLFPRRRRIFIAFLENVEPFGISYCQSEGSFRALGKYVMFQSPRQIHDIAFFYLVYGAFFTQIPG